MKPFVALLMLCGLSAMAAWWVFGERAAPGASNAAPPAGESRIEIRWQDGGIVLHGSVPDEATRRVLVEASAARLGGETEQVFDWLVVDTRAAPVAEPAALSQLIRLGLEGWHLQWHARGVWLAVHAPADARSVEVRALAERAFGSPFPVRLQTLPSR